MCSCVLHSAICATSLHCDFGHLLHPLYPHQHLANIWLWSGWFLLSLICKVGWRNWVFIPSVLGVPELVKMCQLSRTWFILNNILLDMERCNNIQHNICNLQFSILWRLYLYQNHNGLRSVPLTKGSVHLTRKQTIRHASFDHWNG